MKGPARSVTNLNHDLDFICQQAEQFKHDPTKQAIEVLFSCTKTKQSHPHLVFNGTAVGKASDQNT